MTIPGYSEDSFDSVAQAKIAAEIASTWGVPLNYVQIFVNGQEVFGSMRSLFFDGEFVMLVVIGLPVPVSRCKIVKCEDGEGPRTFNTSEFGVISIFSNVCEECRNVQFLEFASSGKLDDAYSCRAQCSYGYYRLFDLENEVCRRHSVLECQHGQWLRNGTHARDAQCEPCSGCEGRRLVAHCSRYADTVCEDCGEPGGRQRWAGETCEPVCEEGFVWNVRSKECDFCGTYEWQGGEDGSWRKGRKMCPPGYKIPEKPDNCTHCVACTGLPENALWSEQDDRQDCLWLCRDSYQLQTTTAGESCVPRENVEPTPTMTKVEIECDPGSIPVDFACKSCFEAAELGQAGLMLSSLPLKSEANLTWTWLFACTWQCMHEDDFWEIRSASGEYWECKSLSQRDRLLESGDLSWIETAMRRSAPSIESAPLDTGAGSTADSARETEQQVASSTLVRSVAALGSITVIVVLCGLLVGCFENGRARKWTGQGESETLLPHDHSS